MVRQAVNSVCGGTSGGRKGVEKKEEQRTIVSVIVNTAIVKHCETLLHQHHKNPTKQFKKHVLYRPL